MAIVGYDVKGVAGVVGLDGFALGAKYTAGATGTIEEIEVYVDADGAQNVKAAVWLTADSSLLGQGVINTGGVLDDWLTVTLAAAVDVTNGISYVLGARADGGNVDLPYDAGAAAQAYWDNALAYGDFPDNPLAPGGWNDRKYSIYATIIPPAAGSKRLLVGVGK